MIEIDLLTLSQGKVDPETGSALVTVYREQGDSEDREPFGEVPLIQSLGLTAIPYGPSEDGSDYAEGLCVTGGVGPNAICFGARDTRTAKVVGNAQPGDTIVHSTGPNQAAQLQLKEDKKQAALVTKGSDGKTVLLLLDGKNDKVQIAAFGNVWEMSKKNGLCMLDNTGKAGIQIKDGILMLMGTVVLGGRTPTVPVLSGAPPGVPTPGVFVGV